MTTNLVTEREDVTVYDGNNRHLNINKSIIYRESERKSEEDTVTAPSNKSTDHMVKSKTKLTEMKQPEGKTCKQLPGYETGNKAESTTSHHFNDAT